ncbi:MAG: ribosome maturation factor RimM [Candidatus Limnocylindria bacterium]
MAVARVLGAKGLTGALRVEPLTDVADRLAVGASVFLEDEAAARSVRSQEAGGRRMIIGLEGVNSREAAQALVGRYLEVEAKPLPEGTYYWHQIVGLAVTDVAGSQLGSVVEVFRAGENEVYRIEGPGGELLVPALRSVVRSIDLGAGRMVVDYQPEEVR